MRVSRLHSAAVSQIQSEQQVQTPVLVLLCKSPTLAKPYTDLDHQMQGLSCRTGVSVLLMWIAAPALFSALPAAYSSLPLHFEPNKRQGLPEAEYVARGPGYTVALGPSEAALMLDGHGGVGTPTKLRMQLVGAGAGARLTAEQPTTSVSN